MANKFEKYLPKNDNIADGGFYDDRYLRMSLYDDKTYNMTSFEENQYR